MVSTHFLAQALGIIMITVSVSFLMNRDQLHDILKDVMSHAGLQFVAGMMPLILGTLLVLGHPVWRWQLSVLVTLVGWLILLIGVFRLCFVKVWLKMLHDHAEQTAKRIPHVLLVLGLVFLYLAAVG